MLNLKKMTENEVLNTMLKYNDLIQRPIIEYSKKTILARPPEIIKDFFEN